MSAITYVTVSTDGPVTVTHHEPSLDWIQRTVAAPGQDWGYIDAVRFADAVAYVHDEGLFIGLPVNYRATLLRNLAVGRWIHPPLVGTAVFCGAAAHNPDDLTLPAVWIAGLRDAPWDIDDIGRADAEEYRNNKMWLQLMAHVIHTHHQVVS
jgi:hypothetical protein